MCQISELGCKISWSHVEAASDVQNGSIRFLFALSSMMQFDISACAIVHVSRSQKSVLCAHFNSISEAIFSAGLLQPSFGF